VRQAAKIVVVGEGKIHIEEAGMSNMWQGEPRIEEACVSDSQAQPIGRATR
jgi:hypothetical protein